MYNTRLHLQFLGFKIMAEIKKAMTDPEFVYVSAEEMGPSQWMSLHNVARTLTPEKMQTFKQFVQAMAALLPCGVCSSHFRKLVSETLQASTPAEALQWTIDVHNAVNKRLGKPVLTNAQAIRAIRQGSKNSIADSPSPAAPCATINTFGYVFMALFIITALALVGVLVFVKKRRTETTP